MPTPLALQLIQDSLMHYRAAAWAGVRDMFKTMARYKTGTSRWLWHQDAL